MPNTHGVGRFFWHTQRYPDNARIQLIAETGTTQEYDAPFRYGRSVLLRVPFTRLAVALGWWRGHTDEETALRRHVDFDFEYRASDSDIPKEDILGDWTVVSHAPEA